MAVEEGNERQREIDAAWHEHQQPPMRLGKIRRDWLVWHFQKQGGRCHYCDTAMRLDWPGSEPRATLDHVVPLSRGGADSRENVVAACRLCNSAKGDMLPEEASLHLPARRAALLRMRERRLSWRPDRARRHE